MMLARKQVCARLGVSDPTLRRWIRAGIFPPPATGAHATRRQLWHEETVSAWERGEWTSPAAGASEEAA